MTSKRENNINHDYNSNSNPTAYNDAVGGNFEKWKDFHPCTMRH